MCAGDAAIYHGFKESLKDLWKKNTLKIRITHGVQSSGTAWASDC